MKFLAYIEPKFEIDDGCYARCSKDCNCHLPGVTFSGGGLVGIDATTDTVLEKLHERFESERFRVKWVLLYEDFVANLRQQTSSQRR